ncbi:ylmG homolog protein 2, chloroplastic [Ricinus communis]|uniref:ylmG homolog protein 2, chloroplastic n=1 Tax=Ricinus communis TaxID=3988 RepID=UPI000772B17A|nr:ylmG homolog protein 2, chloroplastic [Ricinus communis]|eukprot:XP_015572872.1 ylmG homolog protein 2, chloroplastic [Ricinus communis]
MASTEASMENSKGIVPKFVPNCVFLSSWVSQNPFLIRPFKPITLPSPNCALRELHTSLASTADKCFKILHLFASQNPILRKLLSLSSDCSSHITTLQIQCRAYSNSNYLSNHNFAAVLPGDSVAGIVVANGILNFLNIYNTLLIVRLVLTWFPNSPPAIVSPLSTLCDPYLNIFRGIIPPLGGTLDLSPILAFLVLNAFTSTAAALPAELPGKGASTLHTRFTTSQQKWMRRLYGNKPPESSPHAN